MLSKHKLDESDIANKRLQESLSKKTNRKQSETDKLVKQLQIMSVEINIQRAEAIQLNEAVDVNSRKN